MRKKPSAGDAFRKLKEQAEAQKAQAHRSAEDAANDAMMSALNGWMQKAADAMPESMEEQMEAALAGGNSKMNLAFTGILNGDVESEMGTVKQLPGYKALEAACKEENVSLTLTFTRATYGKNKKPARLSLTIDMGQAFSAPQTQIKSGNAYSDGKRRGGFRRR